MDCDAAANLKLSRLHVPVDTLGPGRRAGIWVQGCSIRCPGCVSQDTWDQSAGPGSVPVSLVVEWLQPLAQQGINGITISGGEPFEQPMPLMRLLEQIRSTACLVDLDVLIYSGYVISRLKREHSAILELADAIISGPYVEARSTNLPWRGSSNQRLVLLTDRAVERFALAKVGERSLQVSADGGEVWITGIPRRGDLQRLEAILATKGVVLGGVSWRA